MLPKIKANEPDILLLVIYGQDPGAFINQAQTAGLTAIAHRLRVHARRCERLEGRLRLGGWTFTYDYFDPKPGEPARQAVRRGVQGRVRRGPDFYAANYYENTFDMWELIRRVWKAAADINSGDDLRQRRCRPNLTLVSVYGGDDTTVGTFSSTRRRTR